MDVSDPIYLNERLRQERMRRNWLQREVAERLGTTVVTVSRWERGNQQPSAYFRIKLCALFGKSMEELGLSTSMLPSITQPPSMLPQQHQYRRHLLRRLRRSYKDLLAHSLQGEAWIELGLLEKLDAVQNPVNWLARGSRQAEQSLRTSSAILDVYDESEHELLILGEPGTGKSTLLLALAQQLVARAEQDETYPLPFILPLSLWTLKQSSLRDWVYEQLTKIYDVPRWVSEQWLLEEKLGILFDGLDEMEPPALLDCVAAINLYHRDHLTPLVVCARTAAYERVAVQQRLTLQRAVVLCLKASPSCQNSWQSVEEGPIKGRKALLTPSTYG